MTSDAQPATSDETRRPTHRSSLSTQHSYISLAVAAQLLDMAPASVRRAIVEGRLWGQRVGYPWITSVEAVEEYRRTPRHAGGRPKRAMSAKR
jgi:hypothetical protein